MRIGVDMVRVSQIAHSLSVSNTFASKVFAPGERGNAAQMPLSRAYEFLAGRFAVKEAVIKAMSIRLIGAIAICDIETLATADGCPELHLHESALRISEALGISQWNVSISHENDLAIAVVIAC
jgi:holo-[acyl-carrier protein] synthase